MDRTPDELLRLLAERTSDVYWTIDNRGILTYVAPQVRILIGRQPQELIGAPLQALETPPQYTPLADARDHRLMAFRLLVRDFTTGVEQGTSPAPSFTDGLRCQEVLDAVRESSESGRTVLLP